MSYNLHLESRANDGLRLSQLEEVVYDSAAQSSSDALVVAGDLNLDASKLGVSKLLAEAGFRDAAPTARVATTPPRQILESGRHIDWAFVRGRVEIESAQVHNSIRASDHYPISFELRFTR